MWDLASAPASRRRLARARRRFERRGSTAWLFLTLLAFAAPRAASALCTAGGTSSLQLPATTHLRSYRASFGVPTRMAVDAAGVVYVADPGRRQVIARAPSGRVLARIDSVARPISIAVALGRIYVGDDDSGSVGVFTADWQRVGQLGQGSGEFLHPNDIGVDPDTGAVYVADGGAHAVKIYTVAGAFLSSFGAPGVDDGQFNFPAALFVDRASGLVFVADQLNHRIQAFNLSGAFQYCFGELGGDPGKFNAPHGVSLDAQGRVYVTDSVEGRIQVLDRAGGFVGYIGEFGEDAGRFRIPIGMAIDPSNRLFVAAANNARLEVFGLAAFTDPESVVPADVAIQPDPVDRAAADATVSLYVEVAGYQPGDIAPADLRANGIAPLAGSMRLGDRDGNGVSEARFELPRAALLATLPSVGAGEVAVSGTLGAMHIEGTAPVQVITCGADVKCPLGGADPACNEALCVPDVGCTVRARPDGTGCEDGNACTVQDACQSGACVGEALSCNDGNPCTDDSCDAVAGCVNVDNTASCDDGNPCTGGDVCFGGACSGSPLDCNDDDVCTDDSCDPLLGCVNTANAAPCDDGDACTTGDTCAAGLCAGAPLACDDADVCTDDSCDPLLGCIHASNAASCDDHDLCTFGDHCASGHCGGSPAVCDDGNACTDDSCEPASGCAHRDNDAPCDDGDPGTAGDICDGGGRCEGHTVTGDYALLRWPLEPGSSAPVTLSSHGMARGNVCAQTLRVGAAARIEGDAIAWATSGRAAVFGRDSQVTGNAVSGGGAVTGTERMQLGGRRDESGAASEVAQCSAGRYRAASRRAELASLPPSPGLAFGSAILGRQESRRLPAAGELGAEAVAIDFADLRLAPSASLTIAGTAATGPVIVHVRGVLVLGRGAELALDGLPPEQVIFVVDGDALVHRDASLSGSLFAGGRIWVGSGASIRGALLGNTIRLGHYATVDPHPFAGW